MNEPMNISNPPPAVPAAEGQTYTPGYVPQKIGMVLVCLCVLAVGGVQLFPSLYLLAFGQRAKAEAIHIVKAQEGKPDVIITRDAEWKIVEDNHDRSVVYWNVYRFSSREGKAITFRAPVGSVFRPPQPLLDDDGLPTIITVCYDARNPQTVLLPLELSTWFFPGTIVLFGLMGTAVSLLVLYFARKPIILPHIADAS